MGGDGAVEQAGLDEQRGMGTPRTADPDGIVRTVGRRNGARFGEFKGMKWTAEQGFVRTVVGARERRRPGCYVKFCAQFSKPSTSQTKAD